MEIDSMRAALKQSDRQMDGQKDRQTVEQTEGWTDMTNLIGAYRYYTKAHGSA